MPKDHHDEARVCWREDAASSDLPQIATPHPADRVARAGAIYSTMKRFGLDADPTVDFAELLRGARACDRKILRRLRGAS